MLGGIGPLLILSVCHGAFEHLPTGGRSLALCGSNSAVENTFILSTNPAGLATNRCARFCGYGTRLYGQAELTQVSCELSSGRLGLLASSFGDLLYRESTLSLGAGFSQGGLSLGVSAKVMNLSIEGYGSTSTFGVDAGVAGSVSNSLRLAGAARNVNIPFMGEEELPADLSLSGALFPSENITLCMSFASESGRGLSISYGCEIGVSSALVLRAGSVPQDRLFGWGLGLDLGALSVDYGVSTHDPLGLTQGISFCYTVSGR